MQVEENSEMAIERVFKKEETLERLKKERGDTSEDRARGRGNFKRLGREKEEEAKKMREETRRQMKTWENKEKDWEQMRKREERRHKEDQDGLEMVWEKERESWKGQLQRLKVEQGGEKKERIKIKKILKEREREKEGWEKERLGEQEKLEVEREAKMKALEAQIIGEKISLETKNRLAQERIVKFEEESAKWSKRGDEE